MPLLFTDHDSSSYLSTKEASELSGYNPDYLSRLCREGTIVGKQFGRAWFVERASLDAFCEAQRDRKEQLRSTMSEEREREYHGESQAKREEAPQPIKSPFVARSWQRNSASQPVSYNRPLAALAVALVVVSGTAYGSVSPLIIGTLDQAPQAAERIARTFAPQVVLPESDFRVTVVEESVPSVALVVPSPEQITTNVTRATPQVASVAVVSGDTSGTASLFVSTGEVRVAELVHAATHPHEVLESVARAYVATGWHVLGSMYAANDAYYASVLTTGDASLDAALVVRDTSVRAARVPDAILTAYERSLEAYALATPKAADTMVYGTYTIGSVLADTGLAAPRTISSAVDGAAQEAGDRVLAALDRTAGKELAIEAPRESLAAIEPQGDSLEATVLGFVGNMVSRVDGTDYAAIEPQVAGVGVAPGSWQRGIMAFLGGAFDYVATAVREGARTLASVFGLPSVTPELAVLPFTGGEVATLPTPSDITYSTGEGTIYSVFGDRIAQTIINQYYPQTVVTGPTDEYILNLVRPLVSRNIEGASERSRTKAEKRNGELVNPTIDGGTARLEYAEIKNLVASSTSIGEVTFGVATITSATSTNLFSEQAIFTNASSTNLYALAANLVDAFITNLVTENSITTNATTTNSFITSLRATTGVVDTLTSTLATLATAVITDLAATNATTTNATSTNAYTENAITVNATTTNSFIASLRATSGIIDTLTSTLATIASAVITDLTATNAVLTNATTTNATTTNSYVENAFMVNATTTNSFISSLRVTTGIIDTLTSTLATLTDAVITNLAATNATLTNAVLTNATTTNAYIESLTVGTSSATGLIVSGNTVLGGSSADSIIVNASFNSNLIPSTNATFDIGSPSFFWDDGYFDTITVNNISAASTSIAGTASETFTINSDNATADTEDSSILFYRGMVVPNALLTWNSTRDRFEFNQPLYIENMSGSTTIPTFMTKGIVGQSASILQVLDSSSSTVFAVNPNGRVGIGTSSSASAGQLTIDMSNALNERSIYIPGASTTRSYIFMERFGQPGSGLVIGQQARALSANGTQNASVIRSSGGLDENISIQPGLNASTGARGDLSLNFDGGRTLIGTATSSALLSIGSTSPSINLLSINGAGTDSLTFTSNGRLGIGTTSPSALLALRGTDTSSTSIVLADSNNVERFSVTNGGRLTLTRTNSLILDPFNGSGGNDATIIGTSNIRIGSSISSPSLFVGSGTFGNIGIGTTTPSYRVDVSGTGLSSFFRGRSSDHQGGRISLENSNNSFARFGLINDNLMLESGNGATVNGTLTMKWDTGNVGISTTTPSGRLAITAAGASTGRAFVVANSANAEKFTIFDNGIVNLNNSGTLTQAPAAGQVNIGAGAISSGFSALNLYGANPFMAINNVGGSWLGLASGGQTYMQINLGGRNASLAAFDITATTTSTGTSTGAFTVAGGAGIAGALNVGGQGYFAGTLGVGTTSPSATFAVNGSGRFSDGTRTATFTDGVSAATFMGGNVGIGRETPSNGVLDIFSSSANTLLSLDGTGGPFMRIARNGTTFGLIGSSGNILAGNTNDLGINATNNLYLGSASGAGIAILNSVGNFGIATTSPSARLAVTGSGTGTTRAFAIADSSNVERFTVLDNGRIGTGGYTSPANDLQVGGAGKVGIGTAFTYAALNFQSSSAANLISSSRTDGTQTGYIATNGWNGFHTSSGFGVGGAVPLASQNFYVAFNAGIGTATPAYRLDVAGFINTDEFSGYRMGGQLLGYASSTNAATVFGLGAGGTAATTSATLTGTVAVGYQALSSATTGLGNVGIGYQALTSLTSGANNVAIGYSALRTATSSSANVAIGRDALFNNGGANNVGIGSSALRANTFGYSNIAMGVSSLRVNTLGYRNVAIGENALEENVAGYENVAVGQSAFGRAVSSNNSVAIGIRAGNFNTTGALSTYVGSEAGQGSGNYTSQGSVALGYRAGYLFGTGSDFNTVIGHTAGDNITTGARNIIIGYNTDAPSATGSDQLNIGNTIYGNLSTGMIGIGTTSPFAKLSVAGNIYADGTITGSTITATTSVSAPFFTATNATATSTFAGAFAVGSNALNVLHNGNVGIGTASPSQLLDVQGNISIRNGNGLIIDGGTNLNLYNRGGYTTLTNLNGGAGLDFTSNGGGTSYMRIIAASGNVGIASTTPWGLLSVNPSGITGPSFVVGSSSATQFIVTNAGRVGIGTASPAQVLQVVGAVTAASEGYGFNGNAGATQGMSASGTTLQLTGGASGNITFGNTANAAAYASFIGSTGNFGVGTTSPFARLSVSGNTYIDGRLTASSTVIGNAPNNILLTPYDPANGNVSIIRFNNSNSSGQGRLLFESNGATGQQGGFSYRQHIWAFHGLVLQGARGSVTEPAFESGNGTSDASVSIRGNSSSRALDVTGGNAYFDSSVGIGTTSPIATLSVSSSATNANPMAVFSRAAGFGVKIASNNVVPGDTSDAIFAPYGAATAGIAFNTSSAGTEATRMVISGPGNVGIGTTTPISNFALTVDSGSNNPVYLNRTGGDPGISFAESYATIGQVRADGGLSNIGFSNGGGTFLLNVNTSSGNVGIGTTSPAALLSVAGNGYFTGSLGIGVASPSSAIHVAASAPALRLQDTATGGVQSTLSASGGVLALGADIGNAAAASRAITFNLFNTEAARIATNGSFGIGTTSPSARFAITASGTGTGRAIALANSSNTDTFSVLDNGTGYFAGNLGIGTVATNKLDVQGGAGIQGQSAILAGVDPTVYLNVGVNGGSALSSTNPIYGIKTIPTQGGTGAAIAIRAQALINSPGSTADITGIQASIRAAGASSVNGYGIDIQAPTINGTSTITNLYGLYIGQQNATGVTNAYGVYQVASGDRNYFAGNVGIGTTTPSQALSVQGNALISGSISSIAAITATSTITAANFVGTGSATSTFAGNVRIGNGATPTFIPYALQLNPAATTASIDLYDQGGRRLLISTNRAGIDAFTTTDAFIGYYDAGSMLIRSNTATAGSNVVLQPGATGNVGVATGTPTARLAVTGSGTGTGRAFTVANSSWVDRFTVLDNGTVQVTNQITNNGGDLTLNGQGNVDIASFGGVSFRVRNTGSAVIAGGLGITSSFGGSAGVVNVLNASPTLTGTQTAATFGLRFSPAVSGYTNSSTVYGAYVDTSTITTGTVYSGIFTGGNFGIGTLTPFSQADIVRTTSGNALTLRTTAVGTSNNVGLRFSLADSTVTTDTYNKGAIFLSGNGTGFGIGDMIFALNNTQDTSNVSTANAVMTLRSTGNVGIGTTTPGALLTLSSSDPRIRLQDTDTGGEQWDIQAGVSGLFFNRDGVSDLTLSQTGNVGIGTTSPQNNLHVYSATNAGGITVDGTTNPGFNLRTNNTTRGFLGAVTAANAYVNGTVANDIALQLPNSNNFYIGTGSTAFMAIRSNGNVAIGTTTAASKLVIGANNTTNGAQLTFADLPQAYNDIIKVQVNGATNGWKIRSAGGGQEIFDLTSTNNESRFYVDTSTGRIGINTTAASARLHVVATTTNVLTLQGTGAGRSQIQFQNDAGAGTGSFQADTTAISLNLQNNDFIVTPDGGGTRNFIVRSNGLTGVNISSPTHTLSVGGTTTANAIALYDTNNTTNYSRLRMTATSSSNGHIEIISEAGGSGTSRGLELRTVGASVRIGGGSASGNTDNSGVSFYTPANALDAFSGFRISQAALTASSGEQRGMALVGTVNQSGTATYRGLYVSPLLTATGSGGAFLMDLGTNTASGGALATHTSRFVVTSAGNVGIGTTVPGVSSNFNSQLVVQRDQNTNTRAIVKNDNTGSSATAEIALNASGNSWVMGMGSAANNSNAFYIGKDLAGGTPAAKYLNIDTIGNVGIGNTPVSAGATSRWLTLGSDVGSGYSGGVVYNTGAVTGGYTYAFGDTMFLQGGSGKGAGVTVNGTVNVGLLIDNAGNVSLSDLAGVGNRCVYADSTGQLNVKASDCGSASGGDNLGNHTATQNINLGTSNWLSGDGGSEGITINAAGVPTIQAGTGPSGVIINNATASEYTYITFAESGSGKAYVEFLNSGYADTTRRNNLEIYNSTATGGLTFWTNSVERMRLNSSGNLGIGTSTPSKKLSVQGGNDFIIASYNSSGQLTAGFYNNFSGAGEIYMYNGSGSNTVYLSANASSFINNGANFGIGTSSPSARLHLAGTYSSAADSTIQRLDYGATVNRTMRFGVSTGATTYIQSSQSLDETSYRDIAINPFGGNVGIGTTSPSTILAIDSAATSGTQLSLANSTTGGRQFRFISTGSANSEGAGSLLIYDANADARRLVIDSTGDVGIGNTAPAYKLDVTGTINATEIRVNGTVLSPGTGSNWTVSGADVYRGAGNVGIGTNSPVGHAATRRALIVADTTNNALIELWGAAGGKSIFQSVGGDTYIGNLVDGTGAGDLFLTYGDGLTGIKLQGSTGNVGIGTTSPAYALSVQSSTSGTLGAIVGTNSVGASTEFRIQNTGGNNAGLSLYTNGAASRFRQITNGELYFEHATSSLVAMSINMNTGNVGIGTTTPGNPLGSGRVLNIESSTSGGEAGIYLSRSGGTTGSALGRIGFGITSGQALAYINSTADGSTTAGNLTFFTKASSGSLTERLRIAPDGNIGIGSTNPLTRLSITSGTASSTITALTSSSAGYIFGSETSGTTRMLVRPTGSQTVPVLVVEQASGSGTSGAIFEFYGTGNPSATNKESLRFLVGNPFSITGTSDAVIDTEGAGTGVERNIRINPGGSDVLFVGASGSVGIGTTNPGTAKLSVAGTMNAEVTTALSAGQTAHTLNASSGSNNATSLVLDVRSGGSSRLAINALSGNVGIGTTSPAAKLHVVGDILLGQGGVNADNRGYNILQSYMSLGETEGGATTILGNNVKVTNGGSNLVEVNSSAADGSGWLAVNYSTGLSYHRVGANTIGTQFSYTSNQLFGVSTAGNVRFNAYGAGTLTTDASGNITASSDERLKDVNGEFSRGLDAIAQLSPILYNWNASSGLDQSTQYAGFSAQNVQGAIPEAVDTDPRGFLSLSDRPILAATVNAIKELAGRTDSLSIATTSISSRLTAFEESWNMAQDAAELPQALTATQVTAESLEITESIASNGAVSAARFIVPAEAQTFTLGADTITVNIPSEALTAGKADLYALATYTLAGVEQLRARTELLAVQITNLSTRVAALENGMASSTSETIDGAAGLASSTLKNLLRALGMTLSNGIAGVKALVTEQLVFTADENGTSSAGSIVINAGETEVEVENAMVLPTSKVFITFTGSVQGSWYLTEKETGSFKVKFSQPQPSTTGFDYFIVQTEGQIASVGASQPEPSTSQPMPSAPAPVSQDGGPTVSLLGEAAVQIPQGAGWTDPGATAAAADGTTLSVAVAGSVDVNTPGIYTVTYRATDSEGRIGEASRIVSVLAPSMEGGEEAPQVVEEPAPEPTVTAEPAPEPTATAEPAPEPAPEAAAAPEVTPTPAT